MWKDLRFGVRLEDPRNFTDNLHALERENLLEKTKDKGSLEKVPEKTRVL